LRGSHGGLPRRRLAPAESRFNLHHDGVQILKVTRGEGRRHVNAGKFVQDPEGLRFRVEGIGYRVKGIGYRV